ncbi:MAG: pyridoxal phosphate-dependent aminotransferase [Marmoricola sp.]
MTLAPRSWLDRIDPYRPGRHALTPTGSMASNESALGASPLVVEAIGRAVDSVHRYPDPLADELRGELAARHGVHPDQILVGNGSDELIYLLAWTYLAQGGRAVCADPAYRIDEISTYVVNAELVKVPLRDWAHDLDAMARVEADIAYVVNPHNPTGTVRSREDIERFVAASPARLVVVDEAYVDFADDPDGLTAVPMVTGGRVAVLRTFSKVHGLAGLRVGYLVAPAEVVAVLRKVRAPFTVGSLAQAAAVAAARDDAHRDAVRRHTRAARDEVASLLARSGFEPVPSQANFVLVKVDDEAAFVAHLETHGISVRPGSALGLPGCVRISVPTADGVALLREALAPFRPAVEAAANR